MSAKPYFKLWARETLLSDDLEDLTDHERTVWLYLLCLASVEEQRWSIALTDRIAKKCLSTPAKFNAAIDHMTRLGMVAVADGVLTFVNAERWNEDTERKRKPSDEPERVRERVSKHRNGTRNVTPPVTPSNAAYKEEEEEKEEEEKEDPLPPRSKSGRQPRKPLTPEQRQRLEEDFAGCGLIISEHIEEALAHRAVTRITDEYLYLRGWLRREAARLVPVRNSNDNRPRSTGSLPNAERIARIEQQKAAGLYVEG